MNFINLAHGAFAMAGGYITVLLMNRAGVPFLACLPIAFVGAALLGALLERTLYRPMYAQAAPRPGAVLDRPGLHGGGRGRLLRRLACSRTSSCPTWLQGRFDDRRRSASASTGSSSSSSARVLTVALQWVLSRTRFGSRLRAAVDDPRVAGGLGINVNRVFLLTFAVGSGLAGLGGALGAEVLGLDPTFPLKFMIYFLIVVSVGGTTTITGPLLAALLLGIADVAGQVLRAQARRLHRLQPDDRDPAAGGRRACSRAARRRDERRPRPRRRRRHARCAARDARWRWWELALFAALPLAWLLLPAHALLLNEIAIVALFAVSLDLILGYAGIVSLGHAAFFGFGAYAAALFAKHVMPDPLVGLAVGDRARPRCWALLTSVADPARHRPDAADGHARRRADPATSSPTSSTG